MNNQPSPTEAAPLHNIVAARLAVIPGAGQLYKGHLVEAVGVAVFAMALAGWLGTLLSLAYAVGAYFQLFGISVDWLALLLNPVTLYLGLLPLLLFWAWEVIEAFDEPDLRHSEALDKTTPDGVRPIVIKPIS